MESTPSQTNWQPITKLKKPGMHLLSSLQAVAHGSDSVQYFQWRKSRGSVEKFHGAVVDHVGHVDTRVGRDVTEVGAFLAGLDGLVGSRSDSEVAIIFDWESRWAMDDASGPRNEGLSYEQTVNDQYRGFWEQGINCDIIEQLSDFSGYKVIVAPMLYLLKEGVGERLASFVAAGGTLIASYWTGIVNESDLCFLGGFPGGENSPLRNTLGIWAEEIDSLYDDESVSIDSLQGNALGLTGSFQARELCETIHLENAQALAIYASDFFAGKPALTCNHYGKGQAYYIASRNDLSFNRQFYQRIAQQLGLTQAIATQLAEGVSVTVRHNAQFDYLFVMNFSAHSNVVKLDQREYLDHPSGLALTDEISLEKYQVRVLKRARVV